MPLPTSPLRALAIALAGASGALCVVLALAPADWLAGPLAGASGRHLLLLEPEGSIWNGKGLFVLSDPDPSGASGVALPGRIAWHVRPAALLRGRLSLTLEDESLFAAPVPLEASATSVDLAGGTMRLPATVLAGLGAPWNTIRPGGTLLARWDALHIDRSGFSGALSLDWEGATSGLTPVTPFGQYRLEAQAAAGGARLHLQTLAGPLEMNGDGTIAGDGHLRFHGLARVQAGVDETVATQLSGLVSLLGRRDGDAAILDFGN